MLTFLFRKARQKQADPESEGTRTEQGNRRIAQRFEVKRYNGIIKNDGLSHQFRLKDLSSTGVSGLTAAPIEDGQIVPVELIKGMLSPATVRWTRGTSVGLSFQHPLPSYLVSAILKADQRHRHPAKNEERNLGPLTAAELSVLDCPPEELDLPREDPQTPDGAATDQVRGTDDADDIHEIDPESDECAEDELDRPGEGAERRAEPRIRVLSLIAKIASGNASGLCCLRSLSNSGLMAETSLALAPGEAVELELSSLHRLCGRVVWRDKAGIGVVLHEPVDSVLLLRQLATGDTTQSRDEDRGPQTGELPAA